MKHIVPTSCYRFFGILFLTALIAAGCSDSTTDPGDPGTDAGPVLDDVATKVILATYIDLDAKAGALESAVTTLNTATTDQNLAAAQQAWRDARRPWEQSEAFLFGPVDTKGIDPSIDDWPVNKADLDAVLASGDALTKEYIDGLDGSLKGFHTIEYLLFGVGASKTAAQLTPRELEYLTAVTQSFKGETSELRTSWEPSGENFVAELAGAGEEGSIYTSQADALQEVVAGMIGICDEVASGKISGPYSEQDRTKEESQFSDNSNADFQDNIRSVRNLYRGYYTGTSGNGIGSLVEEKNPTLHAKVGQQIEAAITAIGEMQPSFGEAIFSNKEKVDAAIDAINELKQTLEGEVMPIMQNM